MECLSSFVSCVQGWSGLSLTQLSLITSVLIIVLSLLARSAIRASNSKKKNVTGLLNDAHYQKNEVSGKFDEYMEYYESGDRTTYDENISKFYNLVTDFYEYGWGESFHFTHQNKGESFKDAILRHEKRIVDDCNVKEGMRVLDCGCGVGGPARNVARMSGAHVTGITISPYQVKHANDYIKRDGLQDKCEVIAGNFMELAETFGENTFDVVYAIEATCHAPKLQLVYEQIYKVLKPGGRFCSYEWVCTPEYDEKNPKHKEIVDEICRGNGLPVANHKQDVLDAADEVGFDVVLEEDLAPSSEVPWFSRMKMSKTKYLLTHITCWLTELLRISPKGTTNVHGMLMKTAKDLTAGGEAGIYTPMYWVVFQKPK